MLNDTIVAPVTVPGKAGVAIIRISGPEALAKAAKLYKGKNNLSEVASHSINYGKIFDPLKNCEVDEGLFLVMRAPHSFTAEDVVEIQCHGNHLIVGLIIEILLSLGLRMAEPGEFSKRAFLNGRLNLPQAEALLDIIEAQSVKGLNIAYTQLKGSQQEAISQIKEKLLSLIAFLEVDIDFPEDDLERLSFAETKKRLENLLSDLEKFIIAAEDIRIYREGFLIVIIGSPNAGKSTLLNAILEEERAIVTDIPGTTRDVIEESILLEGVKVRLVDTAGLRATDNLIEKMGIVKTEEFVEKADLLLWVVDLQQGVSREEEVLLFKHEKKDSFIPIINKDDLLTANLDYQKSILPEWFSEQDCLRISAKTGQGLPELKNKIKEFVLAKELDDLNQPYFTNERQQGLLAIIRDDLSQALTALTNGVSSEFLLIDLHNAWENLGILSGETVSEDLLDTIFSKFCLGK